MGNSEWSLLHDIGYMYFVFGVMAQSKENAKQIRIDKTREKFLEWPSEKNNNENIFKEVMQTIGQDMEDSIDPVLKRVQSSISNIVENLPEDNVRAIIDDLLSIVNAASPQKHEIDQINSIAEQIGVQPSKKQKVKGKSRQKTTDEEPWTLLHDMCYLYYIVASLPLLQGSKDAKKVKLRIDAAKEKISEWPSADVDGKQVVQKVSEIVTKAWSSDGIIVGDKIKELAAKIKKYMPEENYQSVIEDLQYIVNKWSPNKANDETMIKGVARIIFDDGESADEETVASSTADKGVLDSEHISGMAYVYFDVITQNQEQSEDDIQAKVYAIYTKLLEWTENIDQTKEIINNSWNTFANDRTEDVETYQNKIERYVSYMKESMSEKQLAIMIGDLLEIVTSSGKAHNAEISMIKGLADKFGLSLEVDQHATIPAGLVTTIKSTKDFLTQDTDPPYPGQFYIPGTLYEGQFSYMPFPKVIGKGTKYKAEDLFRRFTSDEVDRIVSKIESEGKIPFLVFVKELLETKMDHSGQKAPFWFMPFVITGHYQGTMLYFSQDGFWNNRENPQALQQMCHSDMIRNIDASFGHRNTFLTKLGKVSYPDIDEDKVETMTVSFSRDGGDYEVDIAEFYNGTSQFKIIEAIWNIWKKVVDESRDASSYMFDPAIFKAFHSWQEVIDWAYSDKKKDTSSRDRIEDSNYSNEEQMDNKGIMTKENYTMDKKKLYELIYESNAVSCGGSMLSFIFSHKRMAELGLIEHNDDYEQDINEFEELNLDIIEALKADIEQNGKIPFFVFDDEDDDNAWQKNIYLDNPDGDLSSIENIYESIGYPSKRGPFFFGNYFVINSAFETSVIFTQDGFITFHPNGNGEWLLLPWESFRGTELVTKENSPEPIIHFLPGHDDLGLGSAGGNKNTRACHHESVILLMKEIIDQFWECVEANRNSETQEISFDKFRFITSDNIGDYVAEILNKAGIQCVRADGRNKKAKVTRKKQVQKRQTDAASPAKENLDSEFLSRHTEPSYPGQFYFLTEKYSSKPINIKNFLRLSRTDELFRKFTKNEVDCLVKKIKTTKTIPKLSFIRDILEEKYEIPVKDAPFWFLPFAILAEKIGCFLYIDRNAIYANYEKARVINPCFSWEGATDVTYGNGLLELEDEDDGNLEISISPDPDAEYSDPGVTVSTLVLETEDGHLTINEFHGDDSGSQLLIIKTIWDLWKIVVDYSRGSSIWPQDDKVPNGPEYIYFDSWDALIAWAEDAGTNQYQNNTRANEKRNDGDIKVVDHNFELYRQKVTDALADGVVTNLEKTGLDFFQHKLKLTDEDALRIFEETLSEMQEKPEGKRVRTRTDDTKEVMVEKSVSEELSEEDDGDEKSHNKRITYANWSDFAKEQGAKDVRKKANLPIASKIHDLIIIALRENNRKFEIRYGDGTFSFSMPKEEAKSGKRTFARVGLLSLADKIVYLDTLYKGANDTIPIGGIPRRKNDNTQYVFRLKTIEDFEKVKNSIRDGVIGSYQYLAKS